MRGFDFNGVVDTGRPGLQPTEEDVIITGNTFIMQVYDYLDTHSIRCAVYFPPDKRMSGNRNAVAVWKSEMIRRLRLDTFYEDDTQQWEILKDSCPDTEVIRIT